MWRKLFVSVAILVLALIAVGGKAPFQGEIVLSIVDQHGLHAGDLPLILLASVAIVVVWRSP